ncbi:MAG: cation diffusion facilitator family transporter, partial [Alphaproteobacteria bacterium]
GGGRGAGAPAAPGAPARRAPPPPAPPPPPPPGPGLADLRVKASRAAIIVAAVLVALKTLAYAASGSVALLSSLTDSMLDLVASVVIFLAVRLAIEPADQDHRFGHGKAEAIAGMVRGLLIVLAALFLAVEAVERLFHPEPVHQPGLAMGVLGFSAVLSLGIALYEMAVFRRTRSLAIGADALNYGADVAISLGAMGAIWLAGRPGIDLVDPLFGFSVALALAFSAWLLVTRTFDQLMDREMDEADRARIKGLILSHPDVLGVHDLRSRRAGPDMFIQFHLELDPDLTLRQAHRVADEVETVVARAFPGAEVIAHQEPVGEFIENDLVRT